MLMTRAKRPVKFLPRPALEVLEDRCLLSAAHHAAAGSTILFSQAPTAVQSGLDALAQADSLTAPTSSQTVYLGNKAGIETYTVDISSTGSNTALTVDVAGKAYSTPTSTTTTFGAEANTAVTAEFTAIATALNLTVPAATDSVTVNTDYQGNVSYSFTFAATTGKHGKTYSVDASGNPIGNAQLPLSVFSSSISTALTSAAPVGATALTSASLVTVKTLDGVTTYSVTYRATGIRTTVTVNAAGTLTNLPSTSMVQYSTIPTVAQTELQTLATADGYTGTISATQNVSAYDEANGTVIYSVRLPVTSTGSSGSTYTFTIQVSSDQAGNPTVPPTGNGRGDGGCGGGFGGFGWGGGWGGFGGGDGDGGGSTGTGTTTAGGTSTTQFLSQFRRGWRF